MADLPLASGLGLAIGSAMMSQPPLLFPPWWDDGVVEAREYKTTVTTMRSGLEQRRLLRSRPRRTLQWTTRQIGQQDVARLASALHRGISRDYLIPYWPHGTALTAEGTIGATTLVCDRTDREFVPDGWAVLVRTPDDYELVRIGAASIAETTTTGPNIGDYQADDASIGTQAWDIFGSGIFNPTPGIGSGWSSQPGAGASHYLKLKRFGFHIPSGSVIHGITVVFKAKEHSSGSVTMNVRLQDHTDALTGTGKTQVVTGTTLTTYTLGGPTDLWGITLTAEQINDPDFGLRFWCTTAHLVELYSCTVEIDYSSIDAFTLLTPLANTWPVGTKVFPVFEGNVESIEPVSLARDASAYSIGVVFRSGQFPDRSGEPGRDPTLFQPTGAGELPVQIGDQSRTWETGIVQLEAPGSDPTWERRDRLPRARVNWGVLAADLAQARSFWDSCDDALGRLNTFWVPSFSADLPIVGTQTGGELTIAGCGYGGGPWRDECRRHVFAFARRDQISLHRVSAVDVAGNNEVLSLFPDLENAINPVANGAIGFAYYMRSAEDRREARWEAPGILTANISLIEIPDETPEAGASTGDIVSFTINMEDITYEADWLTVLGVVNPGAPFRIVGLEYYAATLGSPGWYYPVVAIHNKTTGIIYGPAAFQDSGTGTGWWNNAGLEPYQYLVDGVLYSTPTLPLGTPYTSNHSIPIGKSSEIIVIADVDGVVSTLMSPDPATGTVTADAKASAIAAVPAGHAVLSGIIQAGGAGGFTANVTDPTGASGEYIALRATGLDEVEEICYDCSPFLAGSLVVDPITNYDPEEAFLNGTAEERIVVLTYGGVAITGGYVKVTVLYT